MRWVSTARRLYRVWALKGVAGVLLEDTHVAREACVLVQERAREASGRAARAAPELRLHVPLQGSAPHQGV